MTDDERRENEVFEDEVRRIARQLWPSAQYHGAEKVGSRERDGVFTTEESVHLLEATVSRKVEKARDDARKLDNLAKRTAGGTRAVQSWLITRDEPTADQRSAVRKVSPDIKIISFAHFQTRLIDARAYLAARDNYPFGSVRDPQTGDRNPAVEYIQLDMLDQKGDSWSIRTLAEELVKGGRFFLLADYGSGKSMTLREVYRVLRSQHLKNESRIFPVYINLRDHWGQPNAAEVLYRHATSIGFDPAQLVRAWRAGYAVLLLDGFDEMAAFGFQGPWRKLSFARHRALQPVRDLVREQPRESGVVLAGRAHFFDNDQERRTALGLSYGFTEISLNEFSEEQVREYLKQAGEAGEVPDWLPTRPLLVGYLATRGVLTELNEMAGTAEAGDGSRFDEPDHGWDFLVSRIAEREAQIEAGIDGRAVRAVLERLATVARASGGGLGPLTPEDLTAAFDSVCGWAPDEAGMVLLQRLPGLGVDRADQETRSFIDEDFAEACRAGDLVQFVDDPYSFDLKVFYNVEGVAGTLGYAVCGLNLRRRQLPSAKLETAIRRADEAFESSYIPADLFQASLRIGGGFGGSMTVRDIWIPTLEIPAGTGDSSGVTFSRCYFNRIEIDSEVAGDFLPGFEDCYIGEVEASFPRGKLPPAFRNCEIENVATAGMTTRAILEMELPRGTRVMLTILKKLFRQRGSGRKENALFRGLEPADRELVGDVLNLLQSEGIARPSRRGNVSVWVPNRSEMRRVGRIFAAPGTAADPLVGKTRKM